MLAQQRTPESASAPAAPQAPTLAAPCPCPLTSPDSVVTCMGWGGRGRGRQGRQGGVSRAEGRIAGGGKPRFLLRCMWGGRPQAIRNTCLAVQGLALLGERHDLVLQHGRNASRLGRNATQYSPSCSSGGTEHEAAGRTVYLQLRLAVAAGGQLAGELVHLGLERLRRGNGRGMDGQVAPTCMDANAFSRTRHTIMALPFQAQTAHPPVKATQSAPAPRWPTRRQPRPPPPAPGCAPRGP